MALPRMPKIEITKVKDSSISFILSDTDASMANSLRRVMIAEVPTICIDRVYIYDNSSVLSDEFLSHRLGLVPLRSQRALPGLGEGHENLKPINYHFDCECDGTCSNCTVTFTLNKKNTSDATMIVTSADLESDDPTVQPVNDLEPIILVKLKKNQKVSFKCLAQKGVGRTHAKWSPVCTAVFRYEPDIRINAARWEKLDPQKKQEWVRSCPRSVYTLLPDNKVEVSNPLKCIFCDQCVEAAEDIGVDDLVTVKTVPSRFHFKVESTGALKPTEIVESAFLVLLSKLTAVKSAMQMEDPEW